MKPTTKTRNKPESLIQRSIVAELRLAGWGGFFWHTPNEGDVAVQYRSRLKSEGVESGVADLVFIVPPPYIPAARATALEIKAARGTLSAAQKAWLARANSMGWVTATTKGYDATRLQLVRWGFLPIERLTPLSAGFLQ